ncbi:sugar ABC transporter substrate-binding protein [uncultured Sphaerochaeta sp.]|uniref:ABC transporter substrate-binding protein n=1 Tax=uncultured Sphaerochaeta sp. TaxID=886478 RepID=UPI002A0A25BF|nr:sugar ABC transporter substrate-binding protein [uncultured Sphaerochaeta sp.]
MKKRSLLVIGLLVISIALFAQGASDAEKPGEIKTVRWVVWDDPATNGQNQIAEEFMKLNPDLKVEIEMIPFDRYEDKIRTVLAAGETPDLVQINDDFVNMYRSRGLTQGINKYIEAAGVNADDYYKSLWDFGMVDGEKYVFTPAVKVRMIFYNKEMLKKAGLPEPPQTWGDPSWDWAKFLEYAQKLTIRSGDQTTQWGFAAMGDGGFEQTWIATANGEGLFGADSLTADGTNAAAREAIQFAADLIHKYKVHPLWGESNTGPKCQNLFLSEQAAMYFSASNAIGTLRKQASFDWGVAPIPVQNASKTQYANNEPSLVCYGIPKNAKNPEGAGRLIAYLGSDLSQSMYAKTGNIPANIEYAENNFIEPNMKPDNQQVILDGVNYGKSVNFGEYTDMAKLMFRNWLHKVWAGEMGVDEAMDNARPEVENALAGK